MSDTKLLKDKLNNAPEVTSLDSTDRLTVVGPDGSLKKIKNDLGYSVRLENVPKQSWFRIGKSNISNASGFALFSLSQSWRSAHSGSCILAAMLAPSSFRDSVSHSTVSVLAKTLTPIASKARIVVSTTSASSGVSTYLDILLNEYNVGVLVKLISSDNFIYEPSQDASIPQGYEAIELNLSTVPLTNLAPVGGG